MALSTTVGVEFIARNRSAAGISAFNNSLGTTTMYLRRLMTAALAAGGVYGIGYMIKQQMEAIDVTAKLADRLGMGTEALVGLQHGAKLAGVEQDELTRALDFFNRKLGDMQARGAESKHILDQLGVSYKSLIEKSPDEAIGLVADRIAAMETQSKKAAVTNALFGRSSAELLALFAEGSPGIARYRIETEKLGLSFSRIDAAKIEAANDALTRTRAVFTGLFRQTAIELAPYIEAAASAFTDWATQGAGVGKNVTAVFESVTLAIAQTIEEIERLIMKLGQVASPLETMRKQTEAFIRTRERYKAEPGDTRERRLEILKEERQKNGLEPVSQESRIRAAFDNIRRDAEERAISTPRKGAIDISPSALTKIESMNRYTQGPAVMTTEENKQIVDRTRQAVDAIRHMDNLTRQERITNLKAYAAANAEELSKVAEANRALNDEILAIERSRVDAMKVYQAELREDMQSFNLYLSERFADASRSMESSLSNSFQSMIRDGASWRDATIQFLTEVRNSFIKMAADIAARATATSIIEPLMSGLAGALGGGGGGPANQVVSPNYAPNYSTSYSNAGIAPVIGHRGGRVGDLSERRWVDSSIFENAPRFHDLRPGETAIIAQNDEVISRPGRSRAGQPPSIVINNNTGQKFESQGPSFDGERWVVGIIAQNIKQGGGLKKMIGR